MSLAFQVSDFSLLLVYPEIESFPKHVSPFSVLDSLCSEIFPVYTNFYASFQCFQQLKLVTLSKFNISMMRNYFLSFSAYHYFLSFSANHSASSFFLPPLSGLDTLPSFPILGLFSLLCKYSLKLQSKTWKESLLPY